MDDSGTTQLILVVDDNAVSRLIMHKDLLLAGVRDKDIVMVESGESAVREVC